MPGTSIEVVGLAELRRQLRQMENPRRWTTELTRSQREIAKQVAAWSQGTARAMGGPQGHFASAISGRANQRGAYVGVRNPAANAAFWGAKQRTGWNAGNSTPNLPEWVGNSWAAGVAGQGPYAINDTIARHMGDILRTYGDAVDRIWGEATTYTSSTF